MSETICCSETEFIFGIVYLCCKPFQIFYTRLGLKEKAQNFARSFPTLKGMALYSSFSMQGFFDFLSLHVILQEEKRSNLNKKTACKILCPDRKTNSLEKALYLFFALSINK